MVSYFKKNIFFTDVEINVSKNLFETKSDEANNSQDHTSDLTSNEKIKEVVEINSELRCDSKDSPTKSENISDYCGDLEEEILPKTTDQDIDEPIEFTESCHEMKTDSVLKTVDDFKIDSKNDSLEVTGNPVEVFIMEETENHPYDFKENQSSMEVTDNDLDIFESIEPQISKSSSTECLIKDDTSSLSSIEEEKVLPVQMEKEESTESITRPQNLDLTADIGESDRKIDLIGKSIFLYK